MFCKIISVDNYKTIQLEHLFEQKIRQVLFYDNIPEKALFQLLNQSRVIGFPSITLKIQNQNIFPVEEIIFAGVTEIQYIVLNQAINKDFIFWIQTLLAESQKFSPEYNIVLHLFLYKELSLKRLLYFLKKYKNNKNIYMYLIGEIDFNLSILLKEVLQQNIVQNFFFVNQTDKSIYNFFKKYSKEKFLQLCS